MACFCVAALLAPTINRLQFVKATKNEQHDYFTLASEEKFEERAYLSLQNLRADGMDSSVGKLSAAKNSDSVDFQLDIALAADMVVPEFEFRKRTIDSLQPLLALNEWGGTIHWNVQVETLSVNCIKITATSWQGSRIRD